MAEGDTTRAGAHNSADPARFGAIGWLGIGAIGLTCADSSEQQPMPLTYRGTSPIRKRPLPYDPPTPTAGAQEGAVSYGRGTPASHQAGDVINLLTV